MPFRPAHLNFGMDDAGNVAVQMPNGSWLQLMDQKAGPDNIAIVQDPVVYDQTSKTLFAARTQIAPTVSRYGTTPFAQSAVPVILLSSATAISATGAISGLTALPYVPQGVVRVYCFAQAGLAAGFYYAKFTTTTDCQLYTNQAATATPTGITAGAYAGGTGAVTLAGISIPGGALGANGMLRTSAAYAVPNNANVKLCNVMFGSANIIYQSLGAALGAFAQSRLWNRGAQNLQVNNVNNGANGFGLAQPLYNTVDTSQAQTLSFTAQLSAATDFIILEGYTVEILFGA